MAPVYKLTYFNVTALGEPIRFLLSHGGLNWEDVRMDETWPQQKAKYPFGQLPVLEHEGKVVNQSIAIARYVAKQVGLAGKTDWENLEIDAIVDTFDDLRQKIATVHYEADEDLKKTRWEPVLKETVPFYLEKLDKIAAANNGHLALGKLTWADVYLAGMWTYINHMLKGDVLDKYPNLVKARDSVLSQPGIKAWIAKRPKTDF